MRDQDDHRFELLLAEYQSLRDDERNFQSVQATVLAAVVTTLTVATAVLVSTNEPNLLIAGLPMAPLGVLLYLSLIGSVATLRSFYLRAIERELHGIMGDAKDLSVVPGVPAASFAHLIQGLSSPKTGERRTHLQVVSLLALILGVFGGLASYAVFLIRDNDVLRITMVVVYTVGGAILIDAFYSGVIHGRRQWINVVHKAPILLSRPLDRADPQRDDHERTIVSYLLVPRTQELVVKSWFYLAGFLVGYLSRPSGGGSWTALLVGFVVVELLLYQARYQINDLRGRDEDRAHPSAGRRGRLPRGPTAATASALTVYVKVGMAFVLSLAVAPPTSRSSLLSAVILILAITVPYEGLKSLIVANTTTRLSAFTWPKLALYITVGFGYAVRAWIGLRLGRGLGLSTPSLVLAAVTMCAFGTMFVTMTWALEATDYLVYRDPVLGPSDDRDDKDKYAGSPGTCATNGTSRCMVTDLEFAYRPEISRRSHLSALLSQTGIVVDESRPLTSECTSGAAIRVLSRLEPPVGVSSAAGQIWNIALLVAAGCAGPFGYELVGIRISLLAGLLLSFVTIGSAMVLSMTVRWDVMICVMLSAVSMIDVLAVLSSNLGHHEWIVSPLPFAIVCTSYTAFRFLNYRDLTRPLPTPMRIAVLLGGASARFAVRSLTFPHGGASLAAPPAATTDLPSMSHSQPPPTHQ